MKIANRNERFIAALIDYLIWLIIAIIVLSISVYENKRGIIIPIIIFMPYLLKDIYGQSPGKSIVRIKIVDEKYNKRPNMIKMILRNLFIFIIVFDAPFIFFNRKNKRLSDFIFQTVVIKQ